MYTYRVILKRNNRYLVYDNAETGKWEFPGIRSTSENRSSRVVKLQSFLVENNIAALGLSKVYSDNSSILTRKGEKTKSNNEMFLADEFVGNAPENKSWKVLGKSQLLRIGNLDGFTRRFLTAEQSKKSATALFKTASGPSEDHRSVSAVMLKGNKLFVMEHPYQKIWSIPKGHIDGDETAREAMIRELDEELGITTNDMSLLTWYVEDYRGKSGSPTKVKHYIYKVNSWEGTPVNKEREKYGDITMKWMPIDQIGKNEDMSLMTLKAIGQLQKKEAGIKDILRFSSVALPTAYMLPGMLGMMFPSVRANKLRELKRDFGNFKKELPFQDAMGSVGNMVGEASDFVVDKAPGLPDALSKGYAAVQ